MATIGSYVRTNQSCQLVDRTIMISAGFGPLIKRWEFDFVMVAECSAGNQAVVEKPFHLYCAIFSID